MSSKHTFAFFITLIIYLIISINFQISYYWDLIMPFLLYIPIEIISGLILSEYSNEEFASALFTSPFRVISLLISGFVVYKFAQVTNFYSQYFMSPLALLLAIFLLWLFNKLVVEPRQSKYNRRC